VIDNDILSMTPQQAVYRLSDKYKFYWHHKSNLYWAWRLLLEVFELFGSLIGVHKDPIKWELIQISSICINWMYKISNNK
jgi:hypothetical protein